MKRYLLKRVTTGLLTVLIAIVLNFFLIHFAPGDPIRIMAGMDHPSSEQLEALYVRYGLDKPLLVQLGQYIVNLLHGDFGTSYTYNKPVVSLILETMGPSILLALTSCVLAYVVAGAALVEIVYAWPGNARLMRVQAMSLKERVFVKSAEALGESKTSILFRYIIPNGIYPVVANTAMGIASAILMEVSLSFLGLGDPNIISWGQMVYAGRSYMTSAWWVATFPGIAIIITVMSFYLICDGLNTVLNPKAGKRGA